LRPGLEAQVLIVSELLFERILGRRLTYGAGRANPCRVSVAEPMKIASFNINLGNPGHSRG
jgi:hypothetical protein